MDKRIIAGGIAVAAVLAIYFVYTAANRPAFALEVDATRDTTDISGFMYRIKVTNAGTQDITNIKVELGANDVQTKDMLKSGQTYYFYPEPETKLSNVKVTADNGLEVVTDYRTPAKVIGFIGGGR